MGRTQSVDWQSQHCRHLLGAAHTELPLAANNQDLAVRIIDLLNTKTDHNHIPSDLRGIPCWAYRDFTMHTSLEPEVAGLNFVGPDAQALIVKVNPTAHLVTLT